MKTTVFIIEDDPMYSMFVMMRLDELLSYTTHLFHSAEEALENMHLNPDIFVMDYHLPGMNGLEALKKIKAASLKTKVIIMSARADTGVVANILQAGAHDYVVKDKDAGTRIIHSIVAVSGTRK
jgi:DNA-binding NarL/FixJ family response regulator